MRLLGKLRASAAGSAAPELAFPNVLTPGRIPEFCIPPRLPAPCAPESPPPDASLPRRCAADQDLWPREADEGAGRTDWDPRSQAALSLPHLPRARTAYGFCALLESPHTRRKESLFLGGPRAAAIRPRAHTFGGGGRGDGPLVPRGGAPATTPTAPGGLRPPRDALAPRPRGFRLLRAPEGLLRRALRARRSRRLARAPSVSSGDEDEERSAVRVRLLRAEGLAGGAAEPRAVGCRVSFVLQPPGKTRQQRSAVVRRSRKAAFDQDFCLDGLSEDELRRLAVRVKAENKGRGLERGRLLGQGELLLGPLLLL
ncbi:PREDICTED: C2 calcium-dependent domain-containing protein 4B [Ceratotherium simum simum]|uniref:C2 calcium-dependent domain-containing protein 4B n=1 Tax=Ceratotherium simum simum TaxID=73337 RepID=A0ABM0H8Y7_CERSS|nr:PREDICTED: C2 calcium-dependent domain-containing protein 4B [Ceratotherium simum simum]